MMTVPRSRRIGGWAGAAAVLVIAFVAWGVVQSNRAAPTIRPVLSRMEWLDLNPLVLVSSRSLPSSPVRTSAITRHLWKAESEALSRTFAPHSSLITGDRRIFRHVLKTNWRMQNEHIRVTVESIIVVGSWARATFQVKETWGQNLNGETGTAYLRRVHGHWRVVTASEHFIPGEGPG